MEKQSPEGPSRRNVVTGLAAAGVGVPLLAACGAVGAASNPLVDQQKAGKSGKSGSPLTVLTKTSAVPVGSGVILANAVVTQPTAGEFKAFSNICTHQGCTVGSISGGQIICPCHLSHFSIVDGSVESGPAPSPLPAIKITEKNGEIYAT